MKLGICAGNDRIKELEGLGFDYIEPMLSPIAALPGKEYETLKETALSSSLPVLGFNVLFPGDLPLMKGEDGHPAIRTYLQLAFARARALGARNVVFGSGKARSRPEGMDYFTAWRNLREVAALVAREAARHGLQVHLEPLGRKECNMVCSLSEAAGLVASVNHPSLSLLTDYYHMATNGESMEEIRRLPTVGYAHIARHAGRRYPTKADKEELRPFIQALKATRFDGFLSIEGHSENMVKDAPEAIAAIRELWRE